MFSNSVELYDLIYSSLKDYRAESERIAELIRRVAPGAHTILDIACGTGEHARILSQSFGFEVDGLDIEAGFLDVARSKHPGGRFFQGDMTSFRPERRYDVVMTLFSSIGYVRTLEGVTAALTRFREHLTNGGVILVEPWFGPDDWQSGRVMTNTARADGIEVIRMSHSGRRGNVSVLTFDYLIGTASGVEHRQEIHELGLFTKEEMLRCFAAAGLEVEHDPVGLIGRGLYVARAWPEPRPRYQNDSIHRSWHALERLVRHYIDLPLWKHGWVVDLWVVFRLALVVGLLVAENAGSSPLLERFGVLVGALFVADIVVYQLSTALSGKLSSSGLRLLVLSLISYLTIGFAFAQLFLVQRDALAGNPNPLDIAFFSFVTLSTIGFGDIHPQHNEPLIQATVVVEHLVALFYVAVALVVVIGIIRERPRPGE